MGFFLTNKIYLIWIYKNKEIGLGLWWGWAVYFCGYRWVHGVTPMKVVAEDGYRYSIVYYALRGMKDCFTYAVETARGKKKRTEREDGLVEALTGKTDFKINSGK